MTTLCRPLLCFFQDFITRINEEMPNLEAGEESKQIGAHFEATLRHIKVKQVAEAEDAAAFKGPSFKAINL